MDYWTNGGTNGSTNSIDITGAAAGFVDQGTFYTSGNAAYGSASNTTNYAWMNAAGTYVRGVNYGTDTNTQTYGAGTSITPGANTIIQFTGA